MALRYFVFVVRVDTCVTVSGQGVMVSGAAGLSVRIEFPCNVISLTSPSHVMQEHNVREMNMFDV